MTKVTFFLTIAAIPLFTVHAEENQAYSMFPKPTRYTKDITKFLEKDSLTPPPTNAVLCIGSSSMRGWHETIHEDFAPLTVIPRGFGGSTMYDVLYYADKIVLPYKPRAIVLYEGDNDIAHNVKPEKVASTFQDLVKKVHAELPECRIYFISIKPSISRWKIWPKMADANALIKDICEKDTRMIYVDVATNMLNEKGMPKKELFKKDNLHMVRDGYIIWRDTIRPLIIPKEKPHEPVQNNRYETQENASNKLENTKKKCTP